MNADASTTFKVFLVDDHQLLRAGLRLILERMPGVTVVGEAGDGVAAVAAAAVAQPDVVVVDVHLPGQDGIEAFEQMRQAQPLLKGIFLSADSSVSVVRRAMQAGAHAYLLKASASEELALAIEAVRQGRVHLCPDVIAEVVGDYRELLASSRSTPTELTKREQDVLRFVAQGMRNKEIAVAMSLSVKSIESYRSRLMDKLGCHSTADLVRYAIRSGVAPD